MNLDEAVRLLAGTTLIPPGSALDEARRTVLDELAALRQVERNAYHQVQHGDPEAAKVANWILTGGGS